MRFGEEKNVFYQRWENKQKHRYYEIYVKEDMLGWCLTCIWGRKGTSVGRIVHQPCYSYEGGIETAIHISKRRQQRGYILLRQLNEDLNSSNIKDEDGNIFSHLAAHPFLLFFYLIVR